MSFTDYTASEIRAKILIKYPQVVDFFSSTVEADFSEQMDMFLDDAILLLQPFGDIWSLFYLSGLMLLGMHLIARGTVGETNTGTVKKTKSEDSETEYVLPVSSSLGNLSTTKYGMDFEALEKRVFVNWNKNNTDFELGFIV